MNACLLQFQDVLESCGIEVETNWKRIIKPKISTGMAAWARELLAQYPAISWGQFKSKLKVKYSPYEMEEQKASLNKLKTLKLDHCDTLETFVEKFLTLKDLARVKETETLIDYLLHGLDIDLYTPVYLAISRFPVNEKTLDLSISEELRSTYYLLRKDDYYKQEKHRKDEELNLKIKQAVKNHQRKQHSKSSAVDGQALKCYDCGFAPFAYAHKAVCKKNPRNMKKTMKKKSKTIVPKPAADDDTDTSSSDEEGDQTFAVATFSNKGKDKEQVVSMDTDSELGITLGNIAADWSDRIGYEIPEIDPSPYKPNEDHFGSEQERQWMMNELQLFIDANDSISPKAYCNLLPDL